MTDRFAAGPLRLGAHIAILALPIALLATRAGADMLIGLLDALFLVECARARDWRWLRPASIALPLAWWAWSVLVSIPWPGLEPARDAAGLSQALVMGRFFVLIAALAHFLGAEPVWRRRLAVVITAVTAWIVLQCWQQYLFGANWLGFPRWGDGALTGPFREPRAGPVMAMLLFPVMLPAVASLQRSGGRIFAALLAVVMVLTMVLIGQRMPALLTGLGLLVGAILLPRLRIVAAACAAVAAIALALMPLLSPPTFAKLVLRFETQLAHFGASDYGRLYARATAMTLDHPVLGLGFDGFRRHCDDEPYAQPAPDPGCNIHPHNHYFEASTAGGFPGLALFCAAAFAWLAALARTPLDARRAGLFVALLLALWPFASTSALLTLPNAGWMFLLLGWGLALRPPPRAA